MNIQQLINTFSNFIDECSAKHTAILKNKDSVLDRCKYLYVDEFGLYFSNAEILGRSVPRPHLTNYFGINTNEREHPRKFYVFVTLRYNNTQTNVHSLGDIIRAIQIAQKITTEENPLYFYNGEEEYLVSSLSFADGGVLKMGGVDIARISQLAPRLSISANATESEQMLKIQLDLLYQVFLGFNEQGE